jgi:menaquinone-dependent protoporphyrinogen oxidase
MADSILVTYASRTGTTAGVAEVIGETLAAGGAAVDVRPMHAVTDLAPYRAVVAGSAINGAQWLPDALEWVRDHRPELIRRPFAAFLVCMTLAMPGDPHHDEVRKWLQPVRDLVPIVREGLFAGALDISKLDSWRAKVNFSVSVRLGVWSEGDHRDWDAIRAWAEELRPLFAPGGKL